MSTPHGPSADPHLIPARDRMLREQLAARGIHDPAVLDAMARIPREFFVDPAHRDEAYDDHPLQIGLGQTISQPYMVAAMTRLLLLTGRETVLEIGTGSGYQAAILALLAKKVYTVERHPALSAQAAARLTRLGLNNVTVLTGDGSLGWPEFAPYDRILVTCAAPALPPALLNELADRGRLIAPIGDRETQRLVLVDRRGDRLLRGEADDCRFVPLIGAAGFSAEDFPGGDSAPAGGPDAHSA
ncbi:MAG TPA: protein-L-isoaspartate(D-aspartate) O-methyltransferase [Planctomycetota bacterium]|nr:protein-L-isoaspartate(D-aspartate) O-methyltransferase [Planctomycetota bacterium]